MTQFSKNIIFYLCLILIFAGAGWSGFSAYSNKITVGALNDPYKQPPLLYEKFPWTIRSVDTQVISKHWPDVREEAIKEQVGLLKNLGVNYIAIGTPYDRVEDMRLWTNQIHAAGLNVWFRSHWAEWEGDEGLPSTLSKEDYLRRTKDFILANPDLFVEGDAFTVAVEAEQVGIGLGMRFLNWNEYREFLLLEIAVANEAFTEIGLEGKIHTNWLSMNGWILDNQMTQEVMDKIDLIVVDHFVNQSQTIGELEDISTIVNVTSQDLDRWHEKFGKPIFIGEWGYHIFQTVSDDRQAEVIKAMFTEFASKDYLVGVNYWVHMGNPAALIGDEYGTNLTYREAAEVIRSFYNPSARGSLLSPFSQTQINVTPAPTDSQTLESSQGN